MKYLILLIVSLFCLISFADHKKDPVSDEERDRYNELYQNRWDLNNKEKFEFKQLDQKISEEGDKIWNHFNRYMRFERKLIEAQKGDLKNQKSILYWLLPYKRYPVSKRKKVPDCTKDRLEKNECPEIPYMAIYWAKKYFESGYCVWMSSSELMVLMGSYVIPKTDMQDSEDFFRILHYIAFYFYYQSEVFESESYYKKIERKAKIKLKELIPARFSLDPETSSFQKVEEEKLIEPDPRFVGPKRSACLRDKICNYKKKHTEEKINSLKAHEVELRNRLKEEKKQIADKMISDLLKKWSEKYGKDKIYQCRSHDFLESKHYKNKKEFLDKYYPYFN